VKPSSECQQGVGFDQSSARPQWQVLTAELTFVVGQLL
jgi:hypothetical protein